MHASLDGTGAGRAAEPPVRRLIVTADDFGASLPINEAVEAACTQGILTSASLMVAGAAAADAIARARRLPRLHVGLHLVTVCGRPVLPPELVPDLAPGGLLPTHLGRAGVRFFFRPRVRQQLAAELRAQFAAFEASGLPLDHVDTHCHMHLHPTVAALVLALGPAYGLRAVRLPYDPPGGPHVADRLAGAALRPWSRRLRARLRRAGVRHNDALVGWWATGRMSAERVLAAVATLPDGCSELCLHPSTRPAAASGLPAHYWCEQEFAALVDPRVAAAITARGIVRTSFSEW